MPQSPITEVGGIPIAEFAAAVALNPPLAITYLTPSGADDGLTLANACNALLAAGLRGGKVLMGGGSWNVSQRQLITFLATNQTLEVEAQGDVLINSTMVEPGSEQGVLEFVGNADGTSRLILKKVKGSHNAAAPGLIDGILCRYPTWPNSAPTNPSMTVIAEDVEWTGASRCGFRPVYTLNSRTNRLNMSGNKNAGAFLLGDQYLVDEGGKFNNNVTGALTGDYGIAFDSSSVVPYAFGCKLIAPTCNNNGRKGIDSHHSHSTQVIAPTCKGNGYCGVYAVAEDLTKDTGDFTLIGGEIDMAGANSAAGATIGVQVGAAGTLNGAQDPGAFSILGTKIKNCDSTNNAANSCIYISTPTSGPLVKRVKIADVVVENANGANPCRFITSENNSAITYMSVTGCVVHLALLASTSPAVWLQQVTTLQYSDNIVQVDASAGGGWSYLLLPAGVQGGVMDSQFNGAVPSTSYIGGGSTTLRQLGNSQNGAPLADTVGGYTFDTKGHSLATKPGLPTLTAVNANVANAVVTGNDEGFTVTFDLTAAPGANVNLFTVNFANAYGVRPTISLTNSSALATGNNWYVVSPLAAGFTVRNAAALGIAVGYAFDGMVKGRTS